MKKRAVYDEILSLNVVTGLSKHEQLIKGIIATIDNKTLKRGDQLPSINEMVREIGFARKTIVKAYESLKDRGIVESKNFIGYFIASDKVEQELKVAVILYAFHSFQEIFYNKVRAHMDQKVQLDTFFHHNNEQIFETILDNIKAKYGRFIIAPIQNKEAANVLNQFPDDKLILIDRHLDIDVRHSAVYQLFEEPVVKILANLAPKFHKFEKVVLFFKENTDHPAGILNAVVSFSGEQNLNLEICENYEPGMVEKGTAYIFIGDTELWLVLKECQQKNFLPGKDVGVLSHNDSTIKEIVSGGITTFSTDFAKMADRTASLLLDKNPVQELIETELFDRGSL